MNPERRIHPRRILYSPEYLDMGADNGGMLVNISEGGLGFQALSPVVPQTEIPISFSLGTAYRIDVKARVAWVGEQGKVGGAVFGKLSKDSQSLIREWMANADMDHEVDRDELPVNALPEMEGPATREASPFNAVSAPATAVAEQKITPSQVPNINTSVPGTAETAAQNGVVLPSVTMKPVDATPEPVADKGAVVERAVTAAPPSQAAVPHRAPSAQGSSAAPIRSVSERLPAPASEQRAAAPLFQRPTTSRERAPEQERQGNASFSVVPSISAWSRSGVPGSVKQPNLPDSAAPLFPPRNAENIFARTARAGSAHEKSGSGKLFVLGLIIAVAAAGAFYVRTHRQQVGAVITQIGSRVAGTPVASPAKPASAAAVPAAKPQDSGATSSPSAKGTPPNSQNGLPDTQSAAPAQAPAQSTAKQPANVGAAAPSALIPAADKSSTSPNAAPGSSTKTVAQAPSASSSKANPPANSTSKGQNPAAAASATSLLIGQSEYQRAEQYLNGRGVPKDDSEAAQWLWRSLEAGYTDAAIPLANLYLEGNGVSRSCTQARILLDAAAQKNKAEAIQELAQLPDNCQ